MVFSVHVSTRCSTWHQGSDLEGWATPGCAKLALSRLAVYPNGWWSSQLHTSVIYLSTYVDTYVSYCEFHSIPLPFTSITYFHYITLYIYIRIYIYIHIERESWIYLVLRYYAIHGLPVSYDNYVQDMHLLFFHPRHGSPAKIKCLNASVRSLRSTSQRHHQRTELNLATPDMATWQHAPLVMVGISPTTGI